MELGGHRGGSRGFDSLQPHVFLVRKDNHGFDWPILFTPPAWKMHPLTRRDSLQPHHIVYQ
jgi:hypothetical protein